MSKREGYHAGVGAYSGVTGGGKHDVKLRRDRNIDDSGNRIERRRELGDKVERVSGMGLSRPVSRTPIRRYGP